MLPAIDDVRFLGLPVIVVVLLAGFAHAERDWVSIGPNHGLGRFIQDVVADPTAPGTLHAATSVGFVSSRDGGHTWKKHGRGLPAGGLRQLVIHPGHPATLLARSFDGTLFRSDDGGATWSRRQPSAWGVQAVALDPSDPAVVYAGVGWEIHRSTDAGRTWLAAPLPPLDDGDDVVRAASTLIVDPFDPATLYVGAGDAGDFRSRDAGRTFEPISSGIVELAAHPARRGTLFATSGFGASKSIDGGTSWTPVIDGGWIVQQFAFDARDPNTIYAASELGVIRSMDGGDTWNIQDAVPLNGRYWAYRVAAGAPGSLYAVIGGDSITSSADGGDTWTTLPGPATPWVSGLALTAGQRPRLVAGTSLGLVYTSRPGRNRWQASTGTAPLPIDSLVSDPFDPATMFVTGYNPSQPPLFRTTDGGIEWTGDATFPTGSLVTVLAVDPHSSSTLWAALSTLDAPPDCLLKSVDGGASWRPSADGLAQCPEALAVSLSDPQRLYAGTIAPAGVYASVDGGEHWFPSAIDAGSYGVSALVIDPRDPDLVYAATWNGVYRSQDGAGSWVPAGLQDQFVLRLAIDAVAPDTVYAASQFAVFRGQGGTWAVLPGVPGEPQIFALLHDGRRGTLYLGTLDGVWKLSGARRR